MQFQSALVYWPCILALASPPSAIPLSDSPAPTAINAGYTAKIREYTTAPHFLTELVDHLPASATVPSPDKVLGYAVGTPGKLTYSKDIYRYMRELAKTSPRVRVFSAPEKTEEGKEQLLVLVSDEANLANLDRWKEITTKLADPRKLSEADAAKLMSEGKPFYWASGSIHSTETGSPEMLIELAYRLAVEESPFIQAIRKNAIVMITPTLEVDGHDRMVDINNYHNANPGKPLPPLVYWGHYVAHDNNRDGLGMALALSRNQMKTFLEYHPQILHDLHESVPFLYASTGTGPYNAWLDPITIDEWHLLAYHEVEEMTKRGVPGVWTHGFYDGWAPNYMFYVANGHNAVGRFYETFGNMVADTMERTVGASAQRNWYRSNPPLAKVKWSLRNNVNMQQSAILFAMHFVAENRERFLDNFYRKSKRAISKATVEGPAAWVIPADNGRPTEAADMVNLLRALGVEVHVAEKEFKVKGEEGKEGKAGDKESGDKEAADSQRPNDPTTQRPSTSTSTSTIPAGSYVIRMDQPYSRMADMMLDVQYYNPSDPRPYDDTGWTLGALRNVKTVRVTDSGVLKAPMKLLQEDVQVDGKIEGPKSGSTFVLNHTAENVLATLRFALKDLEFESAESSFKIGKTSFNAGSFVLKASGEPAAFRAKLEAAIKPLGLTAHAVDKLPDVKSHPLRAPRIALVHTWFNTQDEGWFRIELDRLRIPYAYISTHALRTNPELRAFYDVILFAPAGDPLDLLNGIPNNGEPLPWKASAAMPNVGLSPDQTDNLRGGIGLLGMANLRRFVEDGGLFIAIAGVSKTPIDFGFINDVSVEEAKSLRTAGSVFNATFADRSSPIAYGYGESLPVYFRQSPLFKVAKLPGADDMDGETPRMKPSGRGTPADPDIVQGRPIPPEEPKKAKKEGEEPEPTEEQKLFGGAYLTPKTLRPRVILRFAKEEKNLLVSGLLTGGSELANRPAVIDAPLGKGHVVLFANNPMWRHQTHGSFFLLFNAMMNFDHLDAGRDAKTSPTKTGASAQ